MSVKSKDREGKYSTVSCTGRVWGPRLACWGGGTRYTTLIVPLVLLRFPANSDRIDPVRTQFRLVPRAAFQEE